MVKEGDEKTTFSPLLLLLLHEYMTRMNLKLIKTQYYQAISIGMELSELKVRVNE